MNSIFHRAKHWQLFTFLFGGVIIFQLLMMIYMSDIMRESILTNRPPSMSRFFWFFIPMILIVMFITYGWQWSIGSGLKDKLPRGVRMNFKLFRAFMIVPVIYVVVYLSFIFMMFSRMENVFNTSNPADAIQLISSIFFGVLIMFPFALFAMFCMFYGFYFCAKTLKSIELGREAELNDYIGYFFLFWFNFVGFWIIQPSVNRITSEGWTPPPTPPGYEPITDPDSTFDPVLEKEYIPPGAKLKTKNHEAFEHDDDFEGLF